MSEKSRFRPIELPPVACPHCHHDLDRAAPIGSYDGPAPGNYMLCVQCGEMSVFDDQLRPRLPTTFEQFQWDADPRLVEAQRYMRERIKEQRHG